MCCPSSTKKVVQKHTCTCPPIYINQTTQKSRADGLLSTDTPDDDGDSAGPANCSCGWCWICCWSACRCFHLSLPWLSTWENRQCVQGQSAWQARLGMIPAPRLAGQHNPTPIPLLAPAKLAHMPSSSFTAIWYFLSRWSWTAGWPGACWFCVGWKAATRMIVWTMLDKMPLFNNNCHFKV